MADREVVVLALLRIGVTRHLVVIRRIEERLAAARQHLVDIALVRDVVDDLVLRRVEYAVQGDRGLHHAQVRSDMSAVGAQFPQQRLADLVRQRMQLLRRETPEVLRSVDFFKIHAVFVFVFVLSGICLCRPSRSQSFLPVRPTEGRGPVRCLSPLRRLRAGRDVPRFRPRATRPCRIRSHGGAAPPGSRRTPGRCLPCGASSPAPPRRP